MESVETRVIPNLGQRRAAEKMRERDAEYAREKRTKLQEGQKGCGKRARWKCGRTRLYSEKERGEGSKEVSDLLTVYASPGVPATSQEFPKWQSRHHLPSLSPSPLYFALLSNLLSSFQAPLHPRSLLHSRCRRCCCCTLGCRTLFTPFAGARALLSFDGESERSHVPWRATTSFN